MRSRPRRLELREGVDGETRPGSSRCRDVHGVAGLAGLDVADLLPRGGADGELDASQPGAGYRGTPLIAPLLDRTQAPGERHGRDRLAVRRGEQVATSSGM
jgi:hypothetical protein